MLYKARSVFVSHFFGFNILNHKWATGSIVPCMYPTEPLNLSEGSNWIPSGLSLVSNPEAESLEDGDAAACEAFGYQFAQVVR